LEWGTVVKVELLNQLVQGVEEVLLERRFNGDTEALHRGGRFGSGEFGQVPKVASDTFDKV
jgi:hypothetical protein